MGTRLGRCGSCSGSLGRCNILGFGDICVCIVLMFASIFVEPDLLLIINPSGGLVALICIYVHKDKVGGWYILI